LGLAEITAAGGQDWTSARLREAAERLSGDAGAGAGPLVVSVMIGSLDHAVDPGAGEPRVPLAEFRENVGAALGSILSRRQLGERPGGGPCLIVITPPCCMTGTNGAGLGLSQARLAEYCAVLLELADDAGAIPVDVNTIFGTSVRWSDERLRRVWTERGDGLTLNTPAHKLIYPYIRGAVSACTGRS